jgi:hypothetical protein
VNELLQMFRMAPKDRVRTSHEWFVTAVYTALAVLPAVVWPSGAAGSQGPWSWWPTFLLFGALTIFMATDYFNRPVHLRALFVVTLMVFHLGVMLPFFLLIGHGFMGLDSLSPQLAEPCWAMVRAYSGFMMLTLGMRASTLLAREPQAVPAVEAVMS